MRRLANLQERAVEAPNEPGVEREARAAAKRAVEYEIVPKIARQIIGKALKEAEAEVLRIAVDGQFKNSAEENMVLRHKPLRVDRDEFLNMVGEEYGYWVAPIRRAVEEGG